MNDKNDVNDVNNVNTQVKSCYQPRNIEQLSSDIPQLETQLRLANQLGSDESLCDLITYDLKIINEMGITQTQVRDFLSLIKNTNEINIPIKFSKNDIDKIINVFNISNATLWRYFEINDKRFLYCIVVHRRIDKCPILTFYDKTYYGADYGSIDHYFLNIDTQETFKYPDIFVLQFFNYGFCQGHISDYRTDPVKLIKFFGLKPNVNYSAILGDKAYLELRHNLDRIIENETNCTNRHEIHKLFSEKHLNTLVYEDDDIVVYNISNLEITKNTLQPPKFKDSTAYCLFVKNPFEYEVSKDKAPKDKEKKKNKYVIIDHMLLYCNLESAGPNIYIPNECCMFLGHYLPHFYSAEIDIDDPLIPLNFLEELL
jgi:hypothetical protein